MPNSFRFKQTHSINRNGWTSYDVYRGDTFIGSVFTRDGKAWNPGGYGWRSFKTRGDAAKALARYVRLEDAGCTSI